ncbi:MAG: flagellar motor switch protein FliN [Microthrixaceae bacterium]|nr:flagellar motor switch protein FliN [Microthrixaceae bacterium]
MRGVWADLDDGRVVAVLVATSALPIACQGPDGSGVSGELEPAISAAATALGTTAGPIRVILQVSDLPLNLTALDPSRPICGAGIFEGDTPVASVGVRERDPSGPPGGAAGPKSTDASRSSGDVDTAPRNLHLLADVELGVSAELGRTTMSMGELLDLQPGGVIELERTVGTPIDVLVNGTLIARGEVVVVEDAYAVRVTEVVADAAER